MYHIIRLLLCLMLFAATILAAAPSSGVAQTRPAPIKRLIDGAWQADVPRVSTAPTAASAGDGGAQSVGPLGSWGRMVFTSARDRNNDIFLYTPIPNTVTTTNLTRHGANDVQPRLNPSADRIAFASNRDGNFEIYLMNVDGGGLTRLTHAGGDDLQPFWSPDGSRIVFASNRGGNYDLYVIGADGGSPTRLTADGAADVMPAWSPDGRTIAWIRASGTTGVLWLMNADGTNQRAITGPLQYLQHPNWSPDGARIAIDYDRDGDGFNDLATIAANGGDLRAVSFPMHTLPPERMVDLEVGSWAPPGDWLAVGVFTYYFSGNNLWLENAYVGRVALAGDQSEALLFPEFDYQPDIRSLDLAPPQTQMDGVPRYMRGTSIDLAWSGEDVGVAGNVVFDVQTRVGSTGAWTPWLTGTTERRATFTGVLGSTTTFRMRGRDAAGNAGAWHGPSGNDTTTFFSTRLSGKLTDNRGRPIPNANLNLSPAAITGGATDLAGGFAAYLSQAGNVTARPAHVGYVAPPATTLAMQGDRTFGAYLLPTNNQIQNSGFEASASQLMGWQQRGSLPVAPSDQPITGARSARLGANCDWPCLTPIDASSVNDDNGAAIAAGADGTVYILFTRLDMSTPQWRDRLFFMTRTPQGEWTVPQGLGIEGIDPQLAIDSGGTLHAIWIAPQERVTYSRRPVGGVWSAPIDVGPGSDAQLILDRQGQVYVSATCWNHAECQAGGSAYYRKRAASGAWLPRVHLPTSRLAFAISHDDRVFAAWEGADWRGLVAEIQADGLPGTPRRVSMDGNFLQPRLAVDRDHRLHVFWTYGSQLFYATVEPDGEVTLPTVLPSRDTAEQVVVDAQGTLHLITRHEWNQQGKFYLVKPAGGTWSTPFALYDNSRARTALTIDHAGRVRILHSNDANRPLRYQETRSAGTAGDVTLAQFLTVPSTTPTLAFLYRLQGMAPANDSRLEAVLTHNGTPTTVFATRQSAAWTLASVDLSPWAGQTVEVAITLQQAAGMPVATALLDDVSVGSWQTPVITTISPSAVERPAQPTQLTIIGANFQATPTIRLGSVPLQSVQLIDSGTLRATVPPGTAPGRYTLWVMNPGGQAAAYDGVVVGKLIALPLIRR